MPILSGLLEKGAQRALLLGSLTALAAFGCGDDKTGSKPAATPAKAEAGQADGGAAAASAAEADTKTDTKPGEGGNVDESGAAEAGAAEAGAAEAGAAEAGAAEAGAAEAGAAEAGAAEAGEAEAGAAEAGAAEAGAAEAGEAEAGEAEAGAEAGAEPAGPDPKALLSEAKNKKTKDDRALAALAEAETAGAELRDVAKAAHDRGNALFATPDRAKTFFEWARDKDPKYPDPVFALAKQAVNAGELEDTKKLLIEVKKRKGTKLLSQIEFDATWDVVKDDPEVQALLK